MTDGRQFSNHHEIETDGICIEAVVQTAVNLALVHNEVPLVQAVSITNNSLRALADMTLTLNLDGRGMALAEPWSVTSGEPIPAGGHVRWDTFPAFAPSYEHLEHLDESHPATLTVSVSRTWGADVRLAVPVQVLAHNEWLNSPVFFESLAAFVQPNTRAVTTVLDRAAELLREHTGDASLGGYQQGPERASLIAAAVYEALRTREIRYLVPPASFEDSGQKVRTTAQVLEQRFGTCVDLSVTYAACLEQAGLHPLLWLINGHAFAGYLREGGTLGQTVITESNAMINLVESGRAVPVEATFYESGEQGSFAAAVAAGKRHFSDPDALRGVIDVHATHRAGTRPLPGSDPVPILRVSNDSEGHHAGPSPLALPSELLVQPDEDDVLLEALDDAPARVRQWKRALLDLSTRNRLLNLGASAEVLDLHIPSDTLALLDDIVHEGTALTLLAQDELSDIQRLQGVRRAQELSPEPVRKLLVEDHSVFVGVTEQAYVTRMRKLQRAARTLLEETGTANLYLTVGALVHRTPTGNDARAPLFLLPVKIEGGSGRSAFQIRVDTTSVAAPNHCLVEWLRIKHDVRIEALENPALDRSGIDIVSALPAIRDALVSHRLDMRIDEVASLAICQFSTFGMWRDLEHHWDVISRNPVVEHLALRPGETFTEPSDAAGENGLGDISVEEAEIPLPIPADGSQLRAVVAASAGRSFVLEGPPGTGKSQTITNLIAHALANGRTVLFVAEKQAALEVVKRRLDAIGLADFTLDLHGRSQRPSEIRAQLKRAIDNATVYDPRGWQAIRATLRARHAPLEEYPQRIHARNGIGVSLWSAYENLQQYGEGSIAPIPATYVAAYATDETPVKDALRNFARAARTVGLCRAHPWSIVGRVSCELDPASIGDASAALENARRSLQAHPQAVKLLQGLDDPGDLDALIPHLEDRAQGPIPTAPRLAQMRSPAWIASRRRLGEEVSRFADLHKVVLSTFTQSFLQHGDTAGLSGAADLAEHGLFGKRKRAERFALTVAPLLNKDVTVLPAQVPGLIIAIDAARTHAAELAAELTSLLGDCAPEPWSPIRPDAPATLAEASERIDRSERFQQHHSELWERIEQAGAPTAEDTDTLRDVAAGWARWRTLLGSGQEECSRWAAGRHWSAAWNEDAGAWSAEVADGADATAQRWTRTVELLDPLNHAGLSELRNELLAARLDAADGEVAYLRGVAAGSLRERATAGGLGGFDPALRGGEIEDLAGAAQESRTEQTVALPAELLDRRPYRSDRLTGQVAELRRRLDAKRRGLSFRQLIERYGDEILQATPCFFVSPASLAQYVPPGAATFDLVVFDEASQVGVPQAIGALGRGRTAVIVGDSQQMPPTSVGKLKAAEEADRGDDDETGVLEDLESILTECVESGLPRLWLSSHYRSHDESLIAFSNAFYYEGRLASLPSPGSDPTAGVEMRKLDGHFNREDTKSEFRTNRVEAEAIVTEIRRRLADPELCDQSIGVVTFNAQQRDLVLNLLEECGDPLVAAQLREDATEGIFVKNLENVQGDERDVVLFSIAFSKRHDAGPLPMNFGPLGTAGGEKRLNVAITRARRKVLLFVSFDPMDIDLSRTSSRGIAHLRSYLEMAAHGPGGLPQAQRRAVVGTDHVRETIAEALRGRGYDVASDYGLSDFSLDLVIREQGAERWQVAIVLDGPRWAKRPTVADRELTPLLLERLMDWGALQRLWLPEWIADKENALHRVDEAVARARDREKAKQAERAAAAAERELAIDDALAGKPETGPEADAGASGEAAEEETVEVETYTFASAEERDEQLTEPEPEPVLLVASKGGATVEEDGAAPPKERDLHARGCPYQETIPTPLGTRDDLGRTTSPKVRQTIAAAVRDTVETEGPIATDRLARSIGRRFGFDRVTSGRQQFILEAVPAELLTKSSLGEFVWPTGLDKDTWRGYRTTPPAISRPLTDIAPEELINAMADTANASSYDDEQELFRATMLVFGQRRLTSQTIARLQACRDLAAQRSRLIRSERGGWRGGA